MTDMEPIAEPFTDADCAAHRVLIARRQAAEDAAIAANHRAEHPRDLAEYAGEGDVFCSPPIIEREPKHSIPFTTNRGAGNPTEGE